MLVLVFWATLSQPGTSDLGGSMKEVALYRNENNTGPITRIYAVSTTDTLWQDMKTYGDLMPYTKYGTTRVYFFAADGPTPAELVPGEQNFDERFQENCLARYDKNTMGQINFTPFPFRDLQQNKAVQ